ncbi:MAG: RDD family protein [Chitinivibrionales bacterium]|nr:RDD family protein [Chitinivibrionales bacterium]
MNSLNYNKLDTLQITTPEGVRFSLVLADPFRRLFAFFLDQLIIYLAVITAGSVLAMLGMLSADVAVSLIILAQFVITTCYGIVFEWWWRGQTIGKRVFRLSVVDEQGFGLSLTQVIMRNIMRIVDTLPVFYLVGGAACLLSRKNQRLGDVAANTIVIHHRQLQIPDLENLFAEKYNTLRDSKLLAAQLRKRCTNELADIALQALIRRNEIVPEKRLRLFHSLADTFKALVTFPEDELETISDEQLVKNVVEVLYRNEAG